MEPERTCPNCHRTTALSALWENLNTCSCGYCFRMSARQRLHYLTDKGSFTELFTDALPADPLGFPRYAEKLETTRASSRETEAVVCGTAPHRRRGLRRVHHGPILYDGQHGHRRRGADHAHI